MGIFSRRPTREEQAKLLAVSQKVMPLFLQLAQNGHIRFQDGQTVNLANLDQRSQVVTAVHAVLENLRLGDLPPYSAQAIYDRAKLVHDLLNATQYEEIGPIEEVAQGIVEGLNAHEMLCFNFYELYPRFKPLREMIENGVRIITYAIDQLFEGGELPEPIRLAFPRFTEHFAKVCKLS